MKHYDWSLLKIPSRVRVFNSKELLFLVDSNQWNFFFLPLVGVLFETFFFFQVDSHTHTNLDFFLSCLLFIFSCSHLQYFGIEELHSFATAHHPTTSVGRSPVAIGPKTTWEAWAATGRMTSYQRWALHPGKLTFWSPQSGGGCLDGRWIYLFKGVSS